MKCQFFAAEYLKIYYELAKDKMFDNNQFIFF